VPRLSAYRPKTLALIDARAGPRVTGIGEYVQNLLRVYGQSASDEVRPICWRSQRDALKSMGLRPWSPLKGRLYHPRLLPRASVVHGPDFTSVDHRHASRIVTVHDLAFVRLPECYPPGFSERLDSLVRRSREKVALFLCDSRSTQTDLLEFYGIPSERSRVIHLGVDSSLFSAHSTEEGASVLARLGLSKPYVLHVGALVPRKDVGTLLEAFRLISDQMPGLDLVFIGTRVENWASDWPRVQDWLRRNSALAERVRVTGYLERGVLPILFSQAALTVSTSLWEGFGLTLLEAMAARCPVVASNAGASPEVAGEGAVYATPKDPGSFADAIYQVLSDSKATERRVNLGAARASAFTWEKTAAATLAAYRDVAGARGDY
jgi:glycosyltransferase involved in cell wall biosynthesis